MEKPKFFDYLRDLVNDGVADDSLLQLQNYLRGARNPLYAETISLRNRWARLCSEVRRGRLTDADARVQENQLVSSLTDLISDAEYRCREKPLPFPPSNGVFKVPDAEMLEKIINKRSTLKRLAWLEQAQSVARSVCRVVTQSGYGTGFLLYGELLVTNHHVIVEKNKVLEAWIEMDFEENLDGSLRPSYRYHLKPESAIISEPLDLCILEIIEDPSLPRLGSWGNLKLAEQIPQIGDNVAIIQHPDGGPKQIALTNNQVVNIFEHRLQYTTDTLPGSSGSPVFNDNWEVVAIHHAGGNMLADAYGNRIYTNEGILALSASKHFNEIFKTSLQT